MYLRLRWTWTWMCQQARCTWNPREPPSPAVSGPTHGPDRQARRPLAAIGYLMIRPWPALIPASRNRLPGTTHTLSPTSPQIHTLSNLILARYLHPSERGRRRWPASQRFTQLPRCPDVPAWETEVPKHRGSLTPLQRIETRAALEQRNTTKTPRNNPNLEHHRATY